MQNYSPFFQTLYDEKVPVGHLGRGTHYSVLRAIVFHDERGKPFPESRSKGLQAQFHDFAIIWDEDHDTRIIKVIERIYAKGLLPFFTFLGERKGGLTALALSDSDALHHNAGNIVEDICSDFGVDCWTSEMGTISNPQGIISDKTANVVLYLNNINMLWKLGLKPIIDSSPQQD